MLTQPFLEMVFSTKRGLPRLRAAQQLWLALGSETKSLVETRRAQHGRHQLRATSVGTMLNAVPSS